MGVFTPGLDLDWIDVGYTNRVLQIWIESGLAQSNTNLHMYTFVTFYSKPRLFIYYTPPPLITAHIVFCPFTKVEESFNLQAIHDLMEYGISQDSLKKFDHFEFPGVVPRTFVGPLLLSSVSWPTSKILEFFAPHLSKFSRQYVFFALSKFRSSISKTFGKEVSIAFSLLSACQFHTIFWASRTLPNILAFPFVIIAFSHWISAISSTEPKRKLLSTIRYMTFTTIIFRFELILLLIPIVLLELSLGSLRFLDAIRVGMFITLISLLISIIIDSYFWNEKIMWPEGFVFYFNAILGKSIEWGVISGPLSILSMFVDARTRRFLLPAISLIIGLSFIGHKEWRFIVYTVPIFNICAAIGWVWIQLRSVFIHRIIITLLFASFMASTAMMIISSHNYPGGMALQRLHFIQSDYPQARIHLDVYTAMTGASRFGQLYNDWEYSKNENHSKPIEYVGYTHILTSNPHIHNEYFEPIDIIYGYERIQLENPSHIIRNWFNFSRNLDNIDSLMPAKIIIGPKVWIMKRKPKLVYDNTEKIQK
ncbi:8079_t:CDS:2 [Diversispora eburnea]|uniref:Mannosyltransferase n=1 Tax=Diversispora eburnea TaxID=1213867 RepID=A0A9N8Z5M8_9GLOM|nr:8079_t:CDS:2 [Diversispora eburnea]